MMYLVFGMVCLVFGYVGVFGIRDGVFGIWDGPGLKPSRRLSLDSVEGFSSSESTKFQSQSSSLSSNQI